MAEPAHPTSRWRDLTRVLQWLRPHWRVQVGLLGLMAVGTGLSLAHPWLLKLVFDQVFGHGRYDLLPWLALGIAASAIAGAGGVFAYALVHAKPAAVGNRAHREAAPPRESVRSRLVCSW